MNETQVTYTGWINRYADWLALVQKRADEVNMTDEVREQVTGPMLKDAWRKHVRPDAFVQSVVELFA